MQSVWNKVSTLGVNSAQSFSLQKKIMISNRISVFAVPLIFLLLMITIFINHNAMRALLAGAAIFFFILTLFLNYKQQTTLSRFLLGMVIPIIILVITTVPKMKNPGVVPVVEYFQHRFLLMISGILPLILFDEKKERYSFYFIFLLNLSILAFLDLIYAFLGISIFEKSEMGPGLKDYYLINAYDLVTALIVFGALQFLKSINHRYEGQMLAKNEALLQQQREINRQNQEIMAQNEELHQQQEEIQAQREFVDEKNKELENTNYRILKNEAALQKTVQKLKEQEKEIKEQNKRLGQRDRKITNSIRSALAIQQSLQAPNGLISSVFQDHFLIYRPKDVVSGDFYWVDQIDGKVILVVADCTGHGVPGAFMTLIGFTLLDKIIHMQQIQEPNQIINYLHHGIQTMLRQKETDNNSGMDLAVVCLEKTEGRKVKLCYSGAKNSIYVKQPGGLIKALKADRRSVGGNQNEDIAFTNQSLILHEGDYIYLASDGFEDQNNVRRKRFGSNKLQIILDNLFGLPSDIQKERLEHILDEYMIDTDQRDDILLLGVQV